MEEFLKSFLEPVSYLIYAVVVYYFSKKDRSAKIKLLLGYYLFASIVLSIGQFVVDNNWVYNVFFFITLNLFSYFFYHVLYLPNDKKIVLALYTCNASLFFINDVVLRQLWQENNYMRSFYFFTIILYSLLFLYETIKDVNETNILERFEFWLISGYLLYFLGSLCIVLYYKYPTLAQRAELWILQNLILFCSSLITGAGTLWLMKQKRFR